MSRADASALEVLSIYTIYDSPSDHPGKFLVREFRAVDGKAIANDKPLIVCDTLHEAREAIPPGLTCFPRDFGDAPPVVESWI